MKKSDARLISRGLDGSLSPEERQRMDALLAASAEARATRQAWEALGDGVRDHAARHPAPDPALAWQDIRREIRRLDAERQDAPDAGWLFRFRVAGAVAALVVIGILGLSAWRLLEGPGASSFAATPLSERVEWVIAEVPGASTMIYTDPETELTVIWMDIAQIHDPRDS